MSAYVILIKNETRDGDELKTYGEKALAARSGHDVTPLARYGAIEVLEGDPAEGVVILQFPDMAAARAWYESPAYQAAREHRMRGGDFRVILAEGL